MSGGFHSVPHMITTTAGSVTPGLVSNTEQSEQRTMSSNKLANYLRPLIWLLGATICVNKKKRQHEKKNRTKKNQCSKTAPNSPDSTALIQYDLDDDDYIFRKSNSDPYPYAYSLSSCYKDDDHSNSALWENAAKVLFPYWINEDNKLSEGDSDKPTPKIEFVSEESSSCSTSVSQMSCLGSTRVLTKASTSSSLSRRTILKETTKQLLCVCSNSTSRKYHQSLNDANEGPSKTKKKKKKGQESKNAVDEYGDRFSISSDPALSSVSTTTSILRPVQIKIRTEDHESSALEKPSTNSSSSTTEPPTTTESESSSFVDTPKPSSSSISLQEFIRESKQRENSPLEPLVVTAVSKCTSKKINPSVHLGEVSASNSIASVGSAFLSVSFDDEYPQLVLKAESSSGRCTTGEEDDFFNTLSAMSDNFYNTKPRYKSQNNKKPSKGKLGIEFGHPKPRKRSKGADNNCKQKRRSKNNDNSLLIKADDEQCSDEDDDDNKGNEVSSCRRCKMEENDIMGWLNEQIDQVWDQVELEENDDDDETVSESEQDETPVIETQSSSEWEERDDANWSYYSSSKTSINDNSNTEIVNTYRDKDDADDECSRLMSNERNEPVVDAFFEPILKPICRFVAATQIPSPKRRRKQTKQEQKHRFQRPKNYSSNHQKVKDDNKKNTTNTRFVVKRPVTHHPSSSSARTYHRLSCNDETN